MGFAVATSAAVGKQLALIINGEVVSAPVVEEPIRHGYVTITGGYEEEGPGGLVDQAVPLSAGTDIHEPSLGPNTRRVTSPEAIARR